MTTTRTGRVVIPNKKYVEPVEIAPIKVAKQAKPVKSVVVPPTPSKSTAVLPAAPQKSKTTEPRTLNLDLSDMPPSNDIKFSKDWGEYNNEFWVKHSFTPKDTITPEYREATDKLGDILPANFRLIPDIPSAFGICNLELKPEFVRPIKQQPLFSKLAKGEYHTVTTKSDTRNIAPSINFFRNNLASFKQYKSDDNISWVITHHRQLVAEILEYYANKENPKIATIKSRFNAITRIFRIAFETKNYELYDKYSTLVIFLGQQFEHDEFDNELSEGEIKKYVPFNIILEKQQELSKQFQLLQNKNTTIGYHLNQDLVLVSLYSLIPPLRDELKILQFTKTVQFKDDWVLFRDDFVFLDLNEDKKRHFSILFNISQDAPELAKILKESYELYPREFVFTPYDKYPNVLEKAAVATLSNRLIKIFSYTGKKVGVNSLRSSYVSSKNSEAIQNGKQLSVNQKEKLAHIMRTSRKYLDEAYLKIFPISQNELQPQVKQEIVVKPVDETTPYQKQINRTRKYYEENKPKVLEQQKQYKDSKSVFEKSRGKMLYYLNSDPNYFEKMKQVTKDKYKFSTGADGRWV